MLNNESFFFREISLEEGENRVCVIVLLVCVYVCNVYVRKGRSLDDPFLSWFIFFLRLAQWGPFICFAAASQVFVVGFERNPRRE